VVQEVEQTRGLRVLAVGAHPDDVELGCGGTLAKLTRAGARVQVVIFSKGRRGAMSDADRAEETRMALATLGITEVDVYDFEDTRLSQHLNAMIEILDTHVAALKPDRAYTMFQHDRHQDHRAVYEASAVACRSVPQFFGYETPSSYPNFMPTVFEPIGDDLETKVNALKCHSSLGSGLYMQE
jgi:LmbE family N-acetylglucosaminyl deacetylase